MRPRLFSERISDGSFPDDTYRRAVLRSIPERIAPSPMRPCFDISSINLLTDSAGYFLFAEFAFAYLESKESAGQRDLWVRVLGPLVMSQRIYLETYKDRCTTSALIPSEYSGRPPVSPSERQEVYDCFHAKFASDGYGAGAVNDHVWIKRMNALYNENVLLAAVPEAKFSCPK